MLAVSDPKGPESLYGAQWAHLHNPSAYEFLPLEQLDVVTENWLQGFRTITWFRTRVWVWASINIGQHVVSQHMQGTVFKEGFNSSPASL